MKKTNEVYILLGVLGLIIAVFAILSGGALFDGGVIQTFAFQFPEFGLLTLGMMIAILTGGINMSLVSTAALSGILGAMVLSNPALEPSQAITLGIVVCMVSAAAMGALNGAIISFLNVPPMLVTIGTMTLFEGISLNLTEGGAISGFPEEFFTIGTGSVLGIPVPLLFFVIVAVALFFLLEKTVWGEKVYMVGSNPKVTRYSGINNKAVLFGVYILSGLLCGLAAIIMISRYNSAKVDYGASYLLQTVAAVVLGGTSISGGYGKVAGTVVAVLIIQLITTGFNILGVNKLYTDICVGVVLIAVLAANTLKGASKKKISFSKKGNPA